MRKIILFTSAIVSIMLMSCNNDDDNTPKQLSVTYQSISGKWFITKGVKPDGSIVNYNGYCLTQRDYVEFFQYRKITSAFFYSDCSHDNSLGCTDFILYYETKRIDVCNGYFNGTITDLTSDTMRLDYDETKNTGIGGLGDVKAMIFSRQ